MTIEIIKKGIKPQDRKVEGTCNRCRAVMRWEASDGEHYYDQRENGEWNTIKCPECGNPVNGWYAP
jgi:endogenous inhibitor of DNA gyrase (YacG/DUF329 family)